MKPTVYLIPSLLDDEAIETIPSYIVEAVKDCQVFFVENERTARRYLKKIWKEMVIDNYEWYVCDTSKVSDTSKAPDAFKQKIKQGKNIGIISEAGCPGVADPGQELIAIAHEMNAEVKPLVGPSSILLALMASGMNGQQFQFIGYLPIEEGRRIRAIHDLELESRKKKCTQIFIETPYRNDQLISSLLKTCKPSTKLCVAACLTGKNEWVRTKAISEWQKNIPNFSKSPTIFLLLAE